MHTCREPPLTLTFRQAPEKSGYLTKMVSVSKENPKWKPRFFILSEGKLTYKKEDSPDSHIRDGTYAHTYVCMYVCMYYKCIMLSSCMYACMHVLNTDYINYANKTLSLCMHACMYVYTQVYVFAEWHLCVYVDTVCMQWCSLVDKVYTTSIFCVELKTILCVAA